MRLRNCSAAMYEKTAEAGLAPLLFSGVRGGRPVHSRGTCGGRCSSGMYFVSSLAVVLQGCNRLWVGDAEHFRFLWGAVDYVCGWFCFLV